MQPDNVASTVIVARPENRPAEVMPRLELKRQSWYVNVAVRAARTWLQVFTALMGAALVVPAVIPSELRGFVLMPIIDQMIIAAQFALLPTFMAVLQNLGELLGRLDVSHPEARG